ncbi:MAG: carboxypeptidase-like regulatory domain-containing protein, partial [FCB group bacterium]|nr:carboxypeptidase-like regulatory domain-containing protein [FCB group bacterium]
MRPRKVLPYIILTALLLLVGQILIAKPSGRISGIVTDSQTGEDLNGVSVMIDGTNKGAKTDLDGKFLISNIPPGTYRLMATSVGFCTVLVLDVEVLADSTTYVLIRMTKSVIDAGAVSTVTGEKKDLDFNQTGSVNIPMIPPQSTAPVATVDELVGRECGKTKDANGELHLRGSRAE